MGYLAPKTTWTPWMWTFVSIAESRAFHRWSRRIEEETSRLSLPPKDGLILRAIMLVEMSQRSMVWRALERSIDLLQAVLQIPRRLTLGPFQMRHASFRPRRQVAQALQLLASMRRDHDGPLINELALFWNGSSIRQPGSLMSYADALRLAIRILSVPYSRDQ